MRDKFAALRRKLRRTSTSDVVAGDRPASDLYECPACGTMVINPASDRCSQCGAASLARR